MNEKLVDPFLGLIGIKHNLVELFLCVCFDRYPHTPSCAEIFILSLEINLKISVTRSLIIKPKCSCHLVVDGRRRRDQSGTKGRHAVLQDLFGHVRNSSADVLRGLREVDTVSAWRERTDEDIIYKIKVFKTWKSAQQACVRMWKLPFQIQLRLFV